MVAVCLEDVAQHLPYSSSVFHKCVKKDELGANNISKDFLPNTNTTNTTIKRGSNCHSRNCTVISGAEEAIWPVRPWPYQYLKPIIKAVAFCGFVSSEHVQCATWINYRISSCIFIPDWTIILGKIYIYCRLGPSY